MREGSSSLVSGSQPDSNNGKPTPTHAYHALKLDVPSFDGSDPNEWFFHVEAFFDYHRTPKDLHLTIVFFHLEGRVVA